ncbi:cytoskeleton-associated protein 2 [Dryobates pubescens]|uniref:cytoskeleton-associated protein 2 n=1 Tax=Dryobates pubescens TaxID=118200 RepID=UPI0023B93E1F|nr:cytoskeleton-associated protein 2 [Dryobates pubescens]
MAARCTPQLPASRRSQPAYREQRRQKVEEYLLRKKTFSGIPIQASQPSVSSSRARRAAGNKLQDTILLSTSSKPEMENKENADKLSWDQSSGTSEENVVIDSSTMPLTSASSGTNCKPEERASKDEVIKIKSQHVSLSKTFLQMKSMKEKQLIAEKQSSNASLPKKSVPGTYRGKIIQSKINSFRRAPKTEGGNSSLPDKKLLPSATTKPAVSSLPTSSCPVVLKAIQVKNYSSSVKPNGVLSFQSKPSDRAAIGSQSGLKKWQPTCAVAPKKVTAQKMMGGKQPPKAASNSSDHRALGVKRQANCSEDARPGVPARPISVAADTKPGQHSKTNGNRKSHLPTQDRRACLDEWRASRGRVMKRPPIAVVQGPQPKREENELSSDDSLEDVLHSEKVNKTLTVCLQLAEQGCQGDEIRAMLEELTQNSPGTKKLAKYWICCMHLERTGPLEKLITVYEEAILAGAMPKDELRSALIETLKSTESLVKSQDEGTATEAQEVVEVKEPNSSVEQVQEAFKDLCYDDDNQKSESDDKKAESGNEVIKKEGMDLELKPSEKSLPKKNKRHRTKERGKKKVKYEAEEQKDDEVKDTAQASNSPEKENTTSLTRNPSATPHLESVKVQDEANDSCDTDLIILTPLRCSQRIRERLRKVTDTVKEQDLGELEATAFIHSQSNALQETSAEVEE